jgi:hypothetical protein
VKACAQDLVRKLVELPPLFACGRSYPWISLLKVSISLYQEGGNARSFQMRFSSFKVLP